jgi:hypothetical protein
MQSLAGLTEFEVKQRVLNASARSSLQMPPRRSNANPIGASTPSLCRSIGAALSSVKAGVAKAHSACPGARSTIPDSTVEWDHRESFGAARTTGWAQMHDA